MSVDAPLQVVMFDVLSGNNDYAVELIAALGAEGPLTVVTVENTRLQPAEVARLFALIPAFAAPGPRWRKALQMAGAYLRLVRECLRAPRRTVLHVQFLRFERFEARLFGALQWLGVRLVFSAHNALPHDTQPWHRVFYRRWYEQVDLVHVLSRSVRREIEAEVGARPRAWVEIGHGPYTRLFARYGARDAAAERARWGIEPSRFVLLQYGLFKEYKGLAPLAEAFVRLPAELRPLLVLSGGGPEAHRAAVRRRVEDGGRAADLMWLERFATDDELCSLIGLADLVLFPYLKVSQSGALFLALTFGKPCLCNDLPGFRETLPDDETLFVDAGDADALARRIEALVRDPAALQALKDALAAMPRDGFDWGDIARRTWTAWRTLAPERRAPTSARSSP